MSARRFALPVILALGVVSAAAQEAEPVQDGPAPETIQIGLSTDTVEITADFSGAEVEVLAIDREVIPRIEHGERYRPRLAFNPVDRAGHALSMGHVTGKGQHLAPQT